ncbi:MAG: hypothetical protein Q8Q10_04635 [bacterium]|nr:hypothetical protein [bacterium]
MPPSPYQDFVRQAKERFAERQKKKAAGVGGYQFTLHAQYKMKQYGLSEQRVRSVIRNPKRREEGIVPKTVAVMQPVSPKKVNGKETWKQEIWVMFVVKNSRPTTYNQRQKEKNSLSALTTKYQIPNTANQIRIISAWRYPGVSPKRNPIPEEILRELEEGSILETGEDV